jgi:flavin reductase (DIM6/NTAB) family NADH-FMN oxidoreductase RutF
MKIKLENFYEILSPRCTVLISTIDKEGRPNAAPFSFITPVSSNPPLVLFAAAPQRHTLANVRETGEFVLNIVPEQLLDNLWICSRAFPKGVSEIKESGLAERKSTIVKAPSIKECLGWLECQLQFEKEAGDHILVVGRVVNAECRDEFVKQGQFDISQAKPTMHIAGRRFAVAEKIIQPKTQ